MDKIKNLSVRKTIFLYMAAALFCSFLLSAVLVRIARRAQMHIWWNYVDQEAYFEAVEREGPYSITDIRRPENSKMTPSDLFVSELCDFLQTYAILILFLGGIRGAVIYFYQNKRKKTI